MKTKILSIFLLLLFLVTPVVADEQNYTLSVHNIPYTTSSPLLTRDDNLLIALEDFSEILLVPITQEQTTYTFSYNNQRVKLMANSRTCTINTQSSLLDYPTLVINDCVYVPIQLLEKLGIPYKVDSKNTLVHIDPPVPYSRNVDKPDDHRFVPNTYNLENVATHIIHLSPEGAFTDTLETTLANKGYISYLDNTSFNAIASEIALKTRYSPYNNITVTFRELDTTVYPNVIRDTVTFPVTIKPVGDTLRITFNNQTIDYASLWATFHPATSLVDLNINKTIDATVMRAFYEYYRNQYDLRDDQYFSPFFTISSERTNTMSHGVYTLSAEGMETHYTVEVYRLHPSGGIHYIVDIKKA